MNIPQRLVIGIGAFLLIMARVPAAAQVFLPEETGLNYSITVGAALMVSENLRNESSPMVGVSWYDVAGANFGNNATFGISADWLQVERNDGTDVSIIPILFNYRQYGAISTYRVFVNFGVGILATTDGIPEMKLDDGSNFGWTGGLGVDVTNRFYFQSRFIGGKNPGDDGLVSVQLGYRF